jgi:hypothetical protein
MKDSPKYVPGTDRTELELAELLRKAEAGEFPPTALRVFMEDGTYDDMVFGGTEEERAKALAGLRALVARRN